MPLFHNLFPEPHRSRHRRTEAILLGVIVLVTFFAICSGALVDRLIGLVSVVST